MASKRNPGKMDNPYYSWSPIVGRPPLRWPNNAPLALCVLVSLETLELFPPKGSVVPPGAVGYGPYPNAFQLSGVAKWEYGNRVGVFRLMDLLDKHGIKATAAMDSELARTNPYLVKQCQLRGWELIAHGVAYSRMITNDMPEPVERRYIAEALDGVEQSSGYRPTGWVSPDYGESERTVRLLAEAGLRYVCDWANDEQPYRMTVPKGEMTALPVAADLDDVLALRVRKVPIDRWARMIVEASGTLVGDGRDNGRLLVLNLHPYLTGQPFRTRYLDEALAGVMATGAVWTATGSEIVDWFATQMVER